MTSPPPTVLGRTAPGFEGVRDAFAANLASGRETGGAVAVWRGDRPLVDLWGGMADPAAGRPWQRDTVVLTYSVTKGMAAAALAWLHARGRIDYDLPVAAYWPAFHGNGKEGITVRTLCAHQAGLCGLDTPLTPALVEDLDALAAVLARQRPAWPPRSRHAYHALSLGFFQNELARRVDEHGRTLRAIVRDEIAGPLGQRLSIGVPEDLPVARIAPVQDVNPWRLFLHPRELPPRFALALAMPWSLTAKSVRNPKLAGPAELDRPVWRRLELPSSNGYATARGVAAMYAALLDPDGALGIDARTRKALCAPTRLPPHGEGDAVFHMRTAYHLGFMRPSSDFPFGSSPTAFGAPGVGGSFGFADPATGIGYAYVTNRLGFNVFDDAREQRLRHAVMDALARA